MAEILTPKQNWKSFSKKKIIRVDMTPMVDRFFLITFLCWQPVFCKTNVMDFRFASRRTRNGTVIDVKKNQIRRFIIGKDNRVFYYQGEKKKFEYQYVKRNHFL